MSGESEFVPPRFSVEELVSAGATIDKKIGADNGFRLGLEIGRALGMGCTVTEIEALVWAIQAINEAGRRQ